MFEDIPAPRVLCTITLAPPRSSRALCVTRGVKFERIVRATGSGTSALVQLGCEEVDLVDDVAVGTGAVGDRRLRRAQRLPS
jgi:hypothetical protein